MFSNKGWFLLGCCLEAALVVCVSGHHSPCGESIWSCSLEGVYHSIQCELIWPCQLVFKGRQETVLKIANTVNFSEGMGQGTSVALLRVPQRLLRTVPFIHSPVLQIVTSASTDLQDYTYYFVPAPWLSVKLLRLLQCYPPPGNVPCSPSRCFFFIALTPPSSILHTPSLVFPAAPTP